MRQPEIVELFRKYDRKSIFLGTEDSLIFKTTSDLRRLVNHQLIITLLPNTEISLKFSEPHRFYFSNEKVLNYPDEILENKLINLLKKEFSKLNQRILTEDQIRQLCDLGIKFVNIHDIGLSDLLKVKLGSRISINCGHNYFRLDHPIFYTNIQQIISPYSVKTLKINCGNNLLNTTFDCIVYYLSQYITREQEIQNP